MSNLHTTETDPPLPILHSQPVSNQKDNSLKPVTNKCWSIPLSYLVMMSPRYLGSGERVPAPEAQAPLRPHFPFAKRQLHKLLCPYCSPGLKPPWMRQLRACLLRDSTLSQLLYRGADGCILWRPTCFCGCAMSSSLKPCCMTAYQTRPDMPRSFSGVWIGPGVLGALAHPPATFGGAWY